MKIIGLTGGLASGKSTVSKLFKRVGIPVVDADNVYKELSKPGKTLYNKLIAEFSEEIVGADYTIDWKKLARIVFADEAKRLRLNEITHPTVKNEIENLLKQAKAADEAIVVVEVPLLYEAGYQTVFDEIIVVTIDQTNQIRRLMARNSIDRATAIQRIDSQMPLEQKVKLATYVIDNSSDFHKTELQFYEILAKIRRI